ncbi:MAG: M23 family metallopeptidase [Cyanobacteria bacterium P01_A01_bin.37]
MNQYYQWLAAIPLCSVLWNVSLHSPNNAVALTTFQSGQLGDSGAGSHQETTKQNPRESDSICVVPVLERLNQHQVSAGETIESIAEQYDLIPATLLGFNPQLINGQVSSGTQITVPPYNGIRVNVPSGTTWQDLADQYNMRADVLFEANGCAEVPSIAFIPGINWSPTAPPTVARRDTQPIGGHPLPAIAPVLRQYGWQTEPGTTKIDFHSGVDLDAAIGTSVLSVGNGTVAFAGEQGGYGKLVVINHQDGLQTRYAQLDSITVRQGDTIRTEQAIGTSGNTGEAYAPHLHFEVRTNSRLGWVAQDPSLYLDNMRMFEQ